MTLMLILNVILATAVVSALVGLLGWSIAASRRDGAVPARARRVRSERTFAAPAAEQMFA